MRPLEPYCLRAYNHKIRKLLETMKYDTFWDGKRDRERVLSFVVVVVARISPERCVYMSTKRMMPCVEALAGL